MRFTDIPREGQIEEENRIMSFGGFIDLASENSKKTEKTSKKTNRKNEEGNFSKVKRERT